LNEIHQVLIKAIMFFYWAQTNAQALMVDTKEVCLPVNVILRTLKTWSCLVFQLPT